MTYSVGKRCLGNDDLYGYIKEQLDKFDEYPVGIQINELFDRDIKGFVKTVSITFHKIRGEDVKRVRGKEFKGKQG